MVVPSPVGHALGGLIVALALTPRTDHAPHDQQGFRTTVGKSLSLTPQGVGLVGWCMVAACLPDVDFAWGRHNMETHSLGFAVLLGAATLIWQRLPRAAVVSGLAVSTHVLFDWLGSDDAPPLGVMALWPLTSDFYYADAWLFGAISRHYWRDDFLTQNVLAVLRELVILLPIAGALAFLRTRARTSLPRDRRG